MNLSNMNIYKSQRGFTLIELLVVISVISILIALSVFGVQGAFENARDTQRKSDLKQYIISVETYANKNNGVYPVQGAGGRIANLCSTLGLGAAAANCPEDPKYTDGSDWFYYNYNSDGVGILFTASTKLESFSSNAPGVAGATSTFFIICSNGKSGSYNVNTFNTENCPL